MWIERVIHETEFIVTLIFGALIAPVVTFLFGDHALNFTLVTAMILAIIADWISGTRASKKHNTYGSKYGVNGVFRTLFIFVFMAIANSVDLIFNSPGVVFGTFTLGVLYHVLHSAIANAIRAGWGSHLPEDLLIWLAEKVKHEINHKERRDKQRKRELERGD